MTHFYASSNSMSLGCQIIMIVHFLPFLLPHHFETPILWEFYMSLVVWYLRRFKCKHAFEMSAGSFIHIDALRFLKCIVYRLISPIITILISYPCFA